jgi:hypothetical protein
VNYPELRRDVLELFTEAQRLSVERAFAFASNVIAWRTARLRGYDAGYDQRMRLRLGRNRRRYAPIQAAYPAATSACPLCGGMLESREGLPGNRKIHIGLCRKTGKAA